MCVTGGDAGIQTAKELARRVLGYEGRSAKMIKLTWIPSWKAYAVRREGKMLGLVRCQAHIPFRTVVEFC